MWTAGADKNLQAKGFSTPPATWKSNRIPPMMPVSERQRRSPQCKADLFHVIHKVPSGDSPYVRAKHVQLIDKDPSRAISLFWSAINSGDRVDSALKDMAIVMKQLNRSDEAIEAIKSFRHLCPSESQESLDNVLVELLKRSGRIDEQIEMLQAKVKHIEEGMAFGAKRTKIARSQGKKIQITIEQEYSRLLGNLAWAYLQQNDFKSAEELYRKALSLEPDKNKQCNLAICLMHMYRITEARFLLDTVRSSSENGQMEDSFAKSYERAIEMLTVLESQLATIPISCEEGIEESCRGIQSLMSQLTGKSSRELSTSINGDQNYVFGSDASRRLIYKHNGETMDEVDRGSFHQNQRSSPQMFANQLKIRSYAYAGKRNKTWITNGGIGDSTWKNAYASPLPAEETPKVPYTQPRRSSWSLRNRDQRRALVGEDGLSGCSRKLLFGQHMMPANVQLMANRDFGVQSQGFTKEISERDSWVDDVQRKVTKKEHKKSQMTLENEIATEAFCSRDCNPYSNSTTADGLRMIIVEPNAADVKSNQELQSQNQSSLGNLKSVQDSSIYESKKSWADMVEEDEQGLAVRKFDSSENKLVEHFQESFSSETPGKYSFGWNAKEESNDENFDSNIICEITTPLDHIDNLSQKMQLFDLKDGYYTQPSIAASSMNNAARRSLCLDQKQKPDRADNNHASPLPRKVLNFEHHNSGLVNGREHIVANDTKLTRRNRLQVFRDITSLPESTKP